MGQVKPGLSIDQHRELAHQLLTLRAQLAEVSATLAAAYPKTTVHVAPQLRACLAKLDDVRAKLCDVLRHEHPWQHPTTSSKIYYP